MSQTASMNEASTQPTQNRVQTTEAQPLIKSATPIALALVAVAAVGFFFSHTIAVVALLGAALVIAVRASFAHHVANDFADMYRARALHAEGKQPKDHAEFVYLRSSEMLARPQLLTGYALAQVQELNAWAKVEFEHA